jgi:hypothetical protein
MTLRSFSVEEISRLEAMLTFLYKKSRLSGIGHHFRHSVVTGTESRETHTGSGFPENAQKSRMIMNSYTRKENPLKPLSISAGLSSFFRQQ